VECGVVHCVCVLFFFFQAEDGIRYWSVTGVQTCALPILSRVELSWRARDNDAVGYVIERAQVEVLTEDQLKRLKKQTPPLPESRSEERRVRKKGRMRRGTEE